jgi:hypothetical protein
MDYVKDNNPKYLKHIEDMLGNFPDYVKNAYDASRSEQVKSLHQSSFADTASREFPIDTPENTFLSYAYCKAASIHDESITRNIKQAAQRHVIDLSSVDEALLKKEASADETAKKFAISLDTGAQGVKFYYPLHNELAIEKSARDLAEDFDRIPLEAFRHGALNLVKAAKAKGMHIDTLPHRIRYTGAHREFNYKFASQAVRQRQKALGDDAAAIYGEIVKSASVDVEHVNDYVNLFMEMDEMNGIKYASEMLNPYEAFFSGHDIDEIEKTANAYVVVSEAPIPIEEFTELATDKVEKEFAFEERELLRDVVKTASQSGGIAASEKLIQFPDELQRKLLCSLAGEGMPKYANIAAGYGSEQSFDAAPTRGTGTAGAGANPMDRGAVSAQPENPIQLGGPIQGGGMNLGNTGWGTFGQTNLGNLGTDPFSTGGGKPQTPGSANATGPQTSV